jgi:vacuolar-type H+-ATPase subunit E/Vma4
LEVRVAAGDLDAAIRIVHHENVTAVGQVVMRVEMAPEIAAGCAVSTADGRFRYENSYRSRARRFEALWRTRLGELYEQRREPVLAGPAASRGDVHEP